MNTESRPQTDDEWRPGDTPAGEEGPEYPEYPEYTEYPEFPEFPDLLEPEYTGPEHTGPEYEKPKDATPLQYYGRSQLPRREVALHRFSPKRKSTLLAISLIAAMTLIITGAVSSTVSLSQLDTQGHGNPEAFAKRVDEAINSTKFKIIALAAGAAGALMVTVFIIRAGPRIVALEFWIRRMGAGDLTYLVEPSGNDEITEIAYDLEVLRRQSTRAQRLDLVQELSDDLQGKNDELEKVLEELHNTQDQMVSRQKLAELGELTAGVAHEIRNPLNLIQNFARTSNDMMKEVNQTLEELDGPPTQEQTEILAELTGELTENMGRMRQHSDRANRIIQDMLAMGRTTKGNYVRVNINELVDDHTMLAYHAARSQDPQFNMQIIKNLAQDAGHVEAVSEDIGRVILNLVGNACYATGERTKADPDHQPTMWLSTTRDQGNVVITVRDNGNGIPEDVMGKIFNPFFTTKPTDKGIGLGLSLSGDIVREHGGSIVPESQPGEYAQFTVRIPASPRTTP